MTKLRTAVLNLWPALEDKIVFCEGEHLSYAFGKDIVYDIAVGATGQVHMTIEFESLRAQNVSPALIEAMVSSTNTPALINWMSRLIQDELERLREEA